MTMDWNAWQGIGTVAAVIISIGVLIYGAGRIAGLNNMASAIREMKEDMKLLLKMSGDHDVKIAVQGERIDNHETRILRLEK